MADSAVLTSIAANDAFQRRVRYAMIKKAQAEFATADAQELALIQLILRGGGPVLSWSLAVVSHSGIASGTYSLDGSDITDTAIDTAVAAAWPVLVG